MKVSVGLHCNYCKLKNLTLQHPPELHDGRMWPVYAITFLSNWWSSTWERTEHDLGLRLHLQSLYLETFLWSGEKSSQSVLPSPRAKLSTEVISFRCQQKLRPYGDKAEYVSGVTTNAGLKWAVYSEIMGFISWHICSLLMYIFMPASSLKCRHWVLGAGWMQFFMLPTLIGWTGLLRRGSVGNVYGKITK